MAAAPRQRNRRSCSSAALPAEVFPGIDPAAVAEDLVVQVGARGSPGAAHTSDHVSAADALARTDQDQKRYRGLSFFLLDLSAPGVNVTPIVKMHGDPDFGEIFLEDVRIPRENLLGDENNGWSVVQTMLNYERIAIAPVTVAQSMIERLVKYIQENPDRPWQGARDRLAQLKIETEVGRLFCYRLAWLHDTKAATPSDAALARIYGTALFKRTATAIMELLGLYSQLDKREDRAPLQGWFEHVYISGIGITLAAGAAEVLKNLIVSLGLEMPRG